jgi:hypothetical protein
MNKIDPNEKIQWLEQRHAELIDELDALNSRLEQTVDSFVRDKNEAATLTSDP